MGIKIGVTGKFSCGKDVFANHLVEKHGFEHISLSDIIRQVVKDSGEEVSATGTNATIFTIDEGVFYIDGFFLKTTYQTIVPYNNSTDGTFRQFASPSASVGWDVTRSITTSDGDLTLKDPASGFYNYNAPGGDRYNIDLTIKHIPFTSIIGDSAGLTFDTSDYIELVRMVGGSTTKTVMYTDYSDIEESFARRTRDESGNYTVTTPTIKIMDYTDVFSGSGTTKFAVGIGPNKSYVGGYEINTQSTANLVADEPIDSVINRNANFSTDFGNYVYIDLDNSKFGSPIVGADNTTGFRSLTDQTKYTIRDTTDVVLGTCNLRTIKKGPDSVYRAYIFNIKMEPDKSFGDVDELFYNTNNYLSVQSKSIGGKGPFNAANKSMLFSTPNNLSITDKGTQNTANDLHSVWVVQRQSSLHIPEGLVGGTLEVQNHDIVPLNNDEDWFVVYGATAEQSALVMTDIEYNVNVNNVSSDTKTLYFSRNNGITAPVGGATASIIYGVKYTNEIAGGLGIKSYRAISNTAVTSSQLTNDGVSDGEIVTIDGVNYAKFVMNNSDIISVSSVVGAGEGGDITVEDNCIVDDGRRQSSFNRGILYVPYADLLNLGEFGDGSLASIRVDYTYYSHSNVGPVTVDSYLDATVPYNSIPTFVDPDSGVKYDHRRYIDFRPIENSDGTYTEFGIPFNHPTAVSTIDAEYYLPRIDKVCLCQDRTYRVIKGTSSVNPVAPQTTSEDMDLYTIVMDSPILNLEKDVKVKYIDNKRYTMKQIGEIEDSLERITSETHLETLYNDAIARATGISGSIAEQGVIVDDFSGHAYSDVTLKDHNCAMDFDYRGLRPSYTTSSVNFSGDMSSNGLTLSSDNIYTYDYVSTSIYDNLDTDGLLKGTGSIQVNPFGSTDYLGVLSLSPYSDTWYDTSVNPKVLVNTFGENNAWESTVTAWDTDGDGIIDGRQYGFGSEYKEWVTHWVGSESLSDDSKPNTSDSRSYTSPIKSSRRRLPGRITETVNDKTVDNSINQFMRSVGITFHGEGLLPGSTVYAMVDGVTVGDGAGYSVGTTGSVIDRVTIPTSTFLSGDRLFRLSDNEDNNLTQTNTAADSTFYSKGLIQNRNGGAVGVRPPMSKRKASNSENIIDEYYEQNLDGNYSAVVNGLQPLSQVIKVDAFTFPQGTFLSSIDLWFKTTDDSLPVMLHLCPMTNGSPHPSLVVPFSQVVANATTISNGPDLGDYTRFDFSSPVYLEPGEYAVCVFTNSPDNTLFKCTDGKPLLNTGGGSTESNFNIVGSRNGSGINLGNLFLPLNNGSRQELSNEILTIRINRCKFDASNDNMKVTFLPVVSSSDDIRGHITNITSNDQLFSSNSINVTYDLDADDAGVFNNIIPNKDVDLNGMVRITSTSSNFKITANFSTTGSQDEAITPIIDGDRISGILAYRRSSFDGAGNGQGTKENLVDSSLATTFSRYISKIVNIEGNQATNDIAVYLKIAKNEGNVMVFVKTTLTDDIDNENWVQLYQDGEQSDDNGDGIIDGNSSQTVSFRPIGALETSYEGIGDFSKYAIKIVPQIAQHASEDGVPLIQDLRAVPLKI